MSIALNTIRPFSTSPWMAAQILGIGLVAAACGGPQDVETADSEDALVAVPAVPPLPVGGPCDSICSQDPATGNVRCNLGFHLTGTAAPVDSDLVAITPNPGVLFVWGHEATAHKWFFCSFDGVPQRCNTSPGLSVLGAGARDHVSFSYVTYQLRNMTALVRAMDGDDDIIGSRAPSACETLDGGFGRDHIEGNGGNDRLRGGDGDDELFGGPGNDWIGGGNGFDTAHGDGGADLCIGTENTFTCP